jgi:FMN-dependent NADH-azoreductase
MNILQINSSARAQGAHSSRLADAIVDRLRAMHPQATLTRRDLALTPHPPLDQAALDALSTPAEERTAEQVCLPGLGARWALPRHRGR